MNYLEVRNILPSAYQPVIEISDNNNETETLTSARNRITIIMEELNHRETRGQQPIIKQELKDKINIWMIKCEEIKQVIWQYKMDK